MTKRLFFFIIISFSINTVIISQITVYQDVFKGGVTGDAYNAVFSFQTGQVDIYIEPGSTIRKALLFVNSYYNPINTKVLQFDGTPIFINQSFAINNPYYNIGSAGGPREIRTMMLDVTHLVNPLQTSYSITPPPAVFPITTEGAYIEYYLYVTYDNPLLEEVCAIVAVNDIQPNAVMNYSFQNLNTINTNQNVAVAIHTSAFCDTIQDGSYILIEGDTIGLLGGDDDHSLISCSGVAGTFYYQNSTLNGLGNDIANTTMVGPDAIANIENYLTSINSVNISFLYQNPGPWPGSQTNPVHHLFLTYTTPCDTFSTTLTDNISVCKGDTAFLEATSGIAYEWLPQVGLSCYNCPNPYYTDTVGRVYTCRIWNTDSCSKVLPVKINILPLPIMPTIVVNPTLCSGNTGHIHITNQPTPYTYTLDGGTPQTTLHFYNQAAGNHLLTIQSANGCSRDTTLFVAEVNNTVAQFSASPTSGDVPLSVNFTNQSQNATNYIWYIEQDTLTTTQANHTFDTSGVFTVMLVAYNTYPHCSDTATVTIVAEYPFTIIAPSLFVSDENHSAYQIYTSGVKELHYELFTDQGKLVYNKVLLPTTGNQPLWNANQLAKGIYLYRIWAVDDEGVEKVISGKVVVM